MFCNKCGEILDDNARKCPVCGASQKGNKTRVNTECDCHSGKSSPFQSFRNESKTSKPIQFTRTRSRSTYEHYSGSDGQWEVTKYTSRSGSSFHGAVENVIAAVREFYARRTDFKGRSSRADFWWAYLFIALVTLTLLILTGGVLVLLWYLIILVPFAALGVRRLHDIDKSGWWLLIKLIPVVGTVVLILWFCKPGNPVNNQWGRRS